MLESDHKSLSFALHRLSDAWTPCQQQQLSFIAEFTSEIKHVAGCNNVVADPLSRPAAAVLPGREECGGGWRWHVPSSCVERHSHSETIHSFSIFLFTFYVFYKKRLQCISSMACSRTASWSIGLCVRPGLSWRLWSHRGRFHLHGGPYPGLPSLTS